MIPLFVNDGNADSEITSSSSRSTPPSPAIDSLKHVNRKVNELIISTKLTKKESSDSGYGSNDHFDSKSRSRVDGFNCVPEYLIDEDSRLSFGSIQEGNESAMNMDTSATSFRKEDFGNNDCDDQDIDFKWLQNELQYVNSTAKSASSLVCGSDASELPRAMDACHSPEKSNEMSFYDNTPLSSPLPCSISPSETSLMLHENLPTDFTITITPPNDIERRPFSEVVFNTLDTSATTKSACRKLKFIEPSGTAPKRMDSPRTPTARLSPKNLGSFFQTLNSVGESSNSNDDYDMELLEMDAMEDHDNMLPPANFDSVIHGQMTHPPLRRGVSLNDSVTSSRRNRQSLTNEGLEGVSSLGENSPPFVMQGFKRSERSVCSPINSKRWKSETEGKENVPQARPVLQKSFSMIDSSLNIMKALEKADLGLIGDHSKPFCLPVTTGKQRDLTCISVHTMAKLVNGEYSGAVNSYRVIDCRYPYEFEGGHIRGAENLYTEDDIYRVLMSTKTETATVVPVEPKRNIVIFHCEFSSHRGPKLAKFLRTKDRDANNEIYPALHYPEIYLLDGGYKEFFKYYTELCDPKTYLPMLEPAYDTHYKHYRAATKSWNGSDRITLSRSGKSRSRLLL